MNSLPFEGIRIVDFTWVGAGPFSTKFFADFGAEVIKIESTSRPDQLRKTEPLVGNKGLNESGYFANRNTNKKSITLNMKDPKSVGIVKELIKESDIVANSFTPNVMKKWGLGYEVIRKIKEDIIYLSMPLQGSKGPHKDYLGYGMTINALIGITYMNGKTGRKPVGTGTNFPDHIPNPCHAAFSVMSALEYRRKTGKGQYIELSQIESSINIFPIPLLDYINNGNIMTPSENEHPSKVPYGIFPCQGEDRWCAISVSNEQEWDGLCKAIPCLRNYSQFDSYESRLKHKAELEELIVHWTKEQIAEEAMVLLQNNRVSCGIVSNAEDLVAKDMHLKERTFWQRLDHEVMGETLYHGVPFKFKHIDTKYRLPAPLIGQHNSELEKWLNLTKEEFNHFIEDGVIR